ncbi:DUF6768 family protein [Rhizobium halophytocola]|uniref:Uncharacterized protein n=1 Tax=Rhizobium halophytocola TaxID=735519 RepID=A0ABS4DXS2_9HYPH|nr:DUF6768 family protein [Rhizobium halophytocola]MBP1850493.1 hypothetical protein [Rhizobium halophytocola]
MSKIDDMIREALEGRDRDLLGQTGELGYLELGLSQFRGRLGWVTWVVMIAQIIFFLIGVWCLFHFYGNPDLLSALKWGISAAISLLFALQLKLSLAPQMQADRVIRELRRVELLLVARGAKSDDATKD